MTREEAIKGLKVLAKDFSGYGPNEEMFNMAIEALEQQPKKGKWIGGELGYCTCCGHEGCASDMWDRCDKPHCPNCGAEVEVDRDS